MIDGEIKTGVAMFVNEDGGVLANPKQPNPELMIIKTIQGLTTEILDNLGKLTDPKATEHTKIAWNKILTLKAKAIEEIDLFEKTTLYELQKAFE